MKTNKRQYTPMEMIERSPERRTRGESTLRRLIATSYPHALFSNVVLALVSAVDGHCLNVKRGVAEQLRNEEQCFGTFDFPRFVELRRTGDGITVLMKRLSIDGEVETITDNRSNHEPLCQVDIPIGPDVPLDVLDSILGYVVKHHYQVVVPHRFRKDLPNTQWRIQQKVLFADNQTGGLDDATFTTTESRGGFIDVINHLKKSLSKPYFHITMSTKAINCHDQNVRLMAT